MNDTSLAWLYLHRAAYIFDPRSTKAFLASVPGNHDRHDARQQITLSEDAAQTTSEDCPSLGGIKR